ncbi:MAG: hypothetical protein ACREQB_00500 [Candidatus Binataceae bacterium]
MIKRILQNRLAMIALAAATMGIMLAASTPYSADAPKSPASQSIKGLV